MSNIRQITLYKKKDELIQCYEMTIMQENNSYILQIKNNLFGEDNNNNKIIIYNTQKEAIDAFDDKFQKKTGNKFSDKFINKIDKYVLDISEEENLCLFNADIMFLLNLITDEKIIKHTFECVGINQMMMPIEKINKLRIEKAEEILQKLNNEIYNNADITELLNEYNRYIPYKKNPNFNDKDEITHHISNIETIKNIFETYNIMIKIKKKTSITEQKYSKMLSLKYNYILEALNININVIESNNPKYNEIIKYAKKDNNNKKILKIFEIIDDKRNKIFENETKNKNNKKLLFHGSPVTNWFSILKNGFYINPMTVGVKINGKAYGDGIYFSDSLNFSFGYCNMNNYDKSGFAILGLCEVALCEKSVSKSPIFVIFNTNQYTFRYLLVVENK